MNIIELNEQRLPSDCYVFKHSTRCPISAAAASRVRQAESSLPLYWVNVVEQRSLSNWIAAELQVRHESPQLILLRSGKVEAVWNHGQVGPQAFSE
ncbi:MAG: DUF2847 family protein [Bdellovibrionales bacterium]|nr:DUF2847 family protein [Bdellovibrionales bacterium]